VEDLAPWLVAAAPLTLVLASFWPSPPNEPRRVAQTAFAAALASLAIALATAAAVAAGGPLISATWGAFGAGLGIYLDAVSATMFVLVAFVGVIVLRYSRNYLDGDPNHAAFMRQMALTIASVMIFIIAGNLVLMTAAWIATSIGLNRLLLFYGERTNARLAGRKKFVVSRLGDICLIGAVLILFGEVGSFDYASLFAAAAFWSAAPPAPILAATVLVAIAALLKSAQFPLHGWILEVMETPTPVSALLHAGIINAGGFLVLRLADIMVLSAPALHVLAIVGAITALFGSLVMLTQTSVKVSLAYSTIAQMGFMLLQCGLGAFAAALLHIVAHSLYKAHAFLSSGGVIDLLRASWSINPGGAPHPARFLVALAAVLAIAAGFAWTFGASLEDKPGVFALGAILLMSLTLLVANAIDQRPNLYVIGRALGAAIVVAIVYFALQLGAESMFASALPAPPALNEPIDLAITLLVIGAFAGVTWLQSQLGRANASPLGQALYVHLAQGLYVNTLANRLVLQWWPRSANERATARPQGDR